jgi:hypothetical protein
MKRQPAVAIMVVAIVAATLAGCDSAPTKAAQTSSVQAAAPASPKEPVLYTGQEALARMSALAQRWSFDAQPVRIESDLTSEATGQAGKSTVWRAWFASPSRGAVKQFVCSGSRLADAPAFGVNTEGGETSYTPQQAALAFQSILVKADSDKAFALAQEHGGNALVKNDPKQPVTYVLEGDAKQRVPLWYVVYGKNGSSSKGVGVINATTGQFLRASK